MSKKQVVEEEFIPFGPEWEKHLMTLPKKFIIQLFREKCLELIKIRNENEETADVD